MNNQKPSLSKNYIYNLIYQILAVIIPLVLIPYLSRVLEPTGVGIYSFSFSITTYFSYFALLGVHLYGTKMIALHKDDQSLLKKTFWEIFILKVFTSSISIALFMMILWFLPNQMILLILGLFLLANLFDVTWYHTGNENFKGIVIRNSVIKILTLVAVFLFVKSINDVWIYATILGGAELIGQLLLWYEVLRSDLVSNLGDIKKDLKPVIHLKEMLLLFLPQAIILLYTSLNVTMIGIISNDVEVGYFDVVSKIVNTILIIATALGTVMIPRITRLYKAQKFDEVNILLKKSLSITTYLAYPMMIGLMVLSSIFVPWFFGALFIDATLILILYAIKIGLVTFSNVIGIQYMIPSGKNQAFIISVSIGAVITLILNLILIPFYGALGAVIGSLVAEVFVSMYQIIKTRKQVPFTSYILNTIKSLISSIFMGISIYLFTVYLHPLIISMFEGYLKLEILIGVTLILYAGVGFIIYALINLILKNMIQKEIIGKVFSKVFKHQ